MVYKKYIKRNGKMYGPYVYHSRRINGKVVSEYRGRSSKKNLKGLFSILIISLILISIISFFAFFDSKISGNVVINLVGSFENKTLSDGKLNLVLKEGELLPSNSKILIENNNKTYEYNLSNLLPNEKISKGNFNFENGKISGSGDGYGLIGTKLEFPLVTFNLEFYNNFTSQKNKSISENESNLSSSGNFSTINKSKQNKNFNKSKVENFTNETFANESLINGNLTNETNSSIKINKTNKSNENIKNKTLKIKNESETGNSTNIVLTNKTSTNKNNSNVETKNSIQQNSSFEKIIKNETKIVNEKNVSTQEKPTQKKSTNKNVSKKVSPKVIPIKKNVNVSSPNTKKSLPTGNVVSAIFKSVSKIFVGLLTGQVSNEQKIISGEVSKGKDFEYNLNGRKLKIVPGSVKSGSKNLSEDVLLLSEKNGKLIVRTNYTIKKMGFGKDYVGERTKTFPINLANLNLKLKEGNLRISLIYNNKKINLFDEKISNETIKSNNLLKNMTNQIFNQTINKPFEIPESINFSTNLSQEEKNFLRFRINQSTINVTVNRYKNKFLVEFNFAGYKAEHAYSGNLSDKELIKKINIDKYLWMKDIMINLLSKKSQMEKITNLSKNYSI